MERLLERWRPYDARRLTRRELWVEAVAATSLVAVAAALAVALPAARPFDTVPALALIAGFALASRVRLYLGAGSAVPTQLVLVPMLFLLPPSAVPACVAAGLAGGALVATLGRRAHPERVLTDAADGWHAVGPSLVFIAAGAPPAELAYWAVPALGVLAQLANDLLAATVREWLGRGIAPAVQTRVILTVYAIDACLTPVGFMVALAGAAEPFALLLAVPLLALLAALAADRRVRIREAVGRLDELTEERARLDRAIHRTGEAFGSKLDRAALVDIGLRSVVEAVGAQFGRADLAAGTIEYGTGHGEAVSEAARGAQRAGGLHVVERDGQVAMAQPLTGGGRTASTEVLVVARRGGTFSSEQRALFGYLVQQTALAIENVALHDQLRHQATVDELTGLSNHRRFHEALAHEVMRMRRSKRPTALALVDIDNFKAVNDAHGHGHGDSVLRAVATIIGCACRGTDEPARYGGDEFAVVLAETDLAGARRFGEGIRRTVEALGVSVSVGVSAMEPGGGDPAALIEAADVALHEAKREGRNRTYSSGWARGTRTAPGRFARPASARPAV